MSNKNQHSVPHLVNGWNFQVAAAIYIFLNFLEEAKEIGLEKREDIELKLSDGSSILAQAKSSLVPEQIQNEEHYTEIYKSLKTLSDKSNNSIEIRKLISIFNYYKPFGNDMLFDYTSYDKKGFNDLTNKSLIFFVNKSSFPSIALERPINELTILILIIYYFTIA